MTKNIITTLKAGQWVKCIINNQYNTGGSDSSLILNKWYKITRINPDHTYTIAGENAINFTFCKSSVLDYFDLENSLDYNPDEVV